MSNKVPNELADQVAVGNCVLFLGAGVSVGTGGLLGIPPGDQLAKELAHMCNYPENDFSLVRVAQYYEMTKGRHELVRYIMEKMSSPPRKPLATHKLIASLPIKIIVTANFDRLLELEFERLGIPYTRVLRNEELAYTDSHKVLYVKMHGSIDVPDSLILTEDDYLDYIQSLSALSTFLKALFATKTLLFVGYRLADSDFKQVYTEMVYHFDRHFRRAYAVQKSPSLYDIKWWARENRNVEIIDADAIEFLTELKEKLSKITPVILSNAPPVPLPDHPYKFLDFFEETDRAIFFGREYEAETMKNLILAHKLSVLYGSSGSGKTSLIKANLIPVLKANGYHTVYLRALGDLTNLLKEELYQFEPESRTLQDFKDAPLRAVFLKTLKPASRWVIFFDQFEEFFIRQGPAMRALFAEGLKQCLGLDQLDLHFVFSLRDDYFARLDEISPASSDIFTNYFHLQDLGATPARICISKPAELFGLHFETALLNELIEDLEDEGVEPPYLQIVCHKLYETLSPGETVFTLKLYQKLGRAQGILSRYLDDVINQFETEIDREAAKSILKSLVTHEETKEAMKLQQITRDTFIQRLRLDEKHLISILDRLRDGRIIRKLANEMYELAHEVMIDKVWHWVTDEEILYKSMRAVVREGLSDWQRLEIALPKEKWRLVNERREGISFTAEEADLMLHSALIIGEDVGYWFYRAERDGAPVWDRANTVLDKGSLKERQNLVKALEERGGEESLPLLERVLRGPYPGLARQARRILESVSLVNAQQVLQLNPSPNDFIYIPKGICIIGQDSSPIGDHLEEPAHEVFVDDFWIARYPVTNIEYASFVEDGGYQPPEDWLDRNYPEDKADYPVVFVSWYDALAYCQWLSEKTGKPYKLPTEAEWEKAASWNPVNLIRCVYAYGNDFDATKCNTRESGYGEPTPIGQYSCAGGDSAYGVSEMTGNVWEWTSTRATDDKGRIFAYPYNALDGRESLESGAAHVLRGGSCYNTRVNSRSSHRLRSNPHNRNGDIGFRVVCKVPVSILETT